MTAAAVVITIGVVLLGVAAGVFAAEGLPTMLALPIGIALMLLVLLVAGRRNKKA